nr:MAG TPA: hypothetical protein [Caudoviricetes sp.]
MLKFLFKVIGWLVSALLMTIIITAIIVIAYVTLNIIGLVMSVMGILVFLWVLKNWLIG